MKMHVSAILRRLLVFLCVLLVPLGVAVVRGAEPRSETPLDRYVKKADPSYQWELARTAPGDGFTTYFVQMTSQTWRTEADVDRTAWRHGLIIVKPDEVRSDKALLLIGGGSHRDDAPQEADGKIVALALGSGSVVAELRCVPNQPLVFCGDGEPRHEDDLIAYTWDKYLTTGEATWLARLPMVKSAVRAMDTIEALLASPAGGGLKIRGFVVAGASKRGWTTWLTGAVDRRVIAIIPIVIDVLNTRESIKHHWAAYGFWSSVLADYVHHKIMPRMDTPECTALMEIEDPLVYRDRLVLPKYIVNASGDQFFLPDSSQFYFDDLPGEKYLRYVPNTDHSLKDSDAVESILAYYRAVIRGVPRPKFSWSFEPDGSIRVAAKDKPREVRLWQATNPKARDFRLETIGPAFKRSDLADRGDSTYVAKVPAPAEGWTAFYVELVYASGGPESMKFTTAVRVVPDVLPYEQVPIGNRLQPE